MSVPLRSHAWRLLAAGFLVASSGLSVADEAIQPVKKGGKFLKRQQWFEQMRGLDVQAKLNSAASSEQNRREAIAALKARQVTTLAEQRAKAEIWQEMGPSSMNMGSWAFGKVSGRLNDIEVHPSDENTIYIASASGGVWKTSNGGSSWSSTFDQVGTLPTGDVHIVPSNPNTLWVGTGDKNGGACAGYFGLGVFKSEDGGVSWLPKNGQGASAMPLSVVNSVVTSPQDPNVVLAGGYGSCNSAGSLSGAGIYRSSDGGANWSLVLSGRTEDMLFVPNSNTVYASVQGAGIYKSSNGGASWALSGSGLSPGSGRLRLAMAPSNPNILYALAGSALYSSSNGGASWSLRSSSACEGQCTYNLALAVHPTNPSTVLVGSIRFALSTNGGSSLSYLTGGWGSSQKVHQDTHVLTYSRSNGNRFWVGGDGGIWRSDNGGSTYTNLNANLNLTQFYDIAIDQANPDKMFGGAQDNSSSARGSSNIWNLTYASGDGFMNIVDPSNPNTVLQTSYPGSYPNIVRSLSGGAPNSFGSLSTSGLTAAGFPWKTPLAAAGSKVWVAGNRLFVGTTSASNFSWSAVGSTLGSVASVITPMQFGSSYPVYVGTASGQIYYSSNGIAGASLSNVTGNYPGGVVSDIAMDPANPARVFITRSGFGASRLYRSTTAGTTWSAVGAGLPNVPANAVALDPRNSQRVFVGTDVGMFVSLDGGNNFTPFTAGMPLGAVVMDLEFDNSKTVLVAATWGRGAWKVNLAGGGGGENQPPSAAFSRVISGLTVNFTDESSDSDGSVVSRNWSFGDGTTSQQTNPVKTYAAAGSYSVTLTVTDDDGASASSSQTVTVSEGGGACQGTALSGSFSGANGQEQIQPNGSWYQSTASGSHKACLVGPAGADFDLYFQRWNGSTWTTVSSSTSSGPNETVSYSGSAGYYRYRVRNHQGIGSYTLTYQKP